MNIRFKHHYITGAHDICTYSSKSTISSSGYYLRTNLYVKIQTVLQEIKRK